MFKRKQNYFDQNMSLTVTLKKRGTASWYEKVNKMGNITRQQGEEIVTSKGSLLIIKTTCPKCGCCNIYILVVASSTNQKWCNGCPVKRQQKLAPNSLVPASP